MATRRVRASSSSSVGRGRRIHAGALLLEHTRSYAVRERGEQRRADVGELERVEVPAAQREILDPRPVQGNVLLPEHLDRGLQRFHQRARAAGRTRSARRSSIDGSGSANQTGAGPTTSSLTPSAANRSSRSSASAGVPTSPSRRSSPSGAAPTTPAGSRSRINSYRRTRSASSSPTTVNRPSDNRSVAGSRPSRSHAVRAAATRSSYASGVHRQTVFHPSASRAASRSSRGPPLPPTSSGGRGSCTGRGGLYASPSTNRFPSNDAGSSPNRASR